MSTPREFYDFCLYLHQDSVEIYGSDPQDWIEGALQLMQTDERRARLRAYVNELLTGEYSDAQLLEIYRNTDPEMGIDRGLRHFFAMVRDIIDRHALAQL
jgi:hypothetical protein